MGKWMKNFLLTALMAALFMFTSVDLFARGNIGGTNAFSLQKSSADRVAQSLSNIGNWGFWLNYNGQTGHDPFTGSSGGYYPRGTSTAIYMDGIIWGGYLEGVADSLLPLRVGGIGYNVGTVPGWIQDDGTPVSTEDERVRLYRIRGDWATLSAAQVAKDAGEINNVPLAQVTAAMTDEIIAQYKADWKDWPVDLGAPYYDNDGDGTYNPKLDADGYPIISADSDYPGIAKADQVLWIVVNDLNEAAVSKHSGCPPIGIELQITLWAYNQAGGGLGQIVFKKYKIINKSGARIDSMFLAQYSDPDVGDYADDLVGCDVDKSLHYVYNGNVIDGEYQKFGLAAPAAGFDFFQGPVVAAVAGQDLDNNGIDDADAAQGPAVIDMQYVDGFVNLPMTSFGYFAAGGTISDPTMGVYTFTENWYNMLNGYIPTDDLVNPTPFYYGSGPDSGMVTKFPASGDPVTDLDGTVSDIDGKGANMAMGDRRMFAATGPFDMEPGDAQELVVALVGGMGKDNLSSITAMRNTDLLAQSLYDDLFTTVPKPPAAPKVVATPFETSILLNWGGDSEAFAVTEKDNEVTGYDFEGYNVYQLPNSTSGVGDATLIKTLDLDNGVTTIYGKRFVPEYGMVVDIPVIFGQDAGVKRFLTIEKDYISGGPLYAGTTYYFAVTAYNYNEDPQLIEDKALESGVVIIPVVMQGTKPGVRYEGEVGQTIATEAGATNGSDGSVVITVVDPSLTTGHDYKVVFHVDADTNSATYGETLWNLIDSDANNAIVLENQRQLAPGAAGDGVALGDGLQVKVYGPPVGINPNRYGVAYGEGTPTSMTYLTGWDFSNPRWIGGRDKGWTGLFGGLGNGEDHLGTSLTDPLDYMDVDVYFAGDTLASEADTTMTVAEIMARSKAQNPGRWSKIISYDGWGTWAPRLADAPFAAYDVESDPPRRLKILILEDSPGNLIWDMGWDPATSSFASNGAYEYIYILNETYDEDYTSYLAEATVFDKDQPILYTIAPQARGSHPYLEGEFDLNIFASNVNTAADEFTFTAPAAAYSDAVAKEDIKNINVFPNPYYAYNALEADRFGRFVTFTHLPEKADIRIFNLAGAQVRYLEKDDETQFMQWDLQNESQLPVGSGIYFAHIDMPKLGKTKVLKVMVIQAKQILEFY